jgi:hypothetical protein
MGPLGLIHPVPSLPASGRHQSQESHRPIVSIKSSNSVHRRSWFHLLRPTLRVYICTSEDCNTRVSLVRRHNPWVWRREASLSLEIERNLGDFSAVADGKKWLAQIVAPSPLSVRTIESYAKESAVSMRIRRTVVPARVTWIVKGWGWLRSVFVDDFEAKIGRVWQEQC